MTMRTGVMPQPGSIPEAPRIVPSVFEVPSRVGQESTTSGSVGDEDETRIRSYPLPRVGADAPLALRKLVERLGIEPRRGRADVGRRDPAAPPQDFLPDREGRARHRAGLALVADERKPPMEQGAGVLPTAGDKMRVDRAERLRSEEHTSELQSRLHLVCRLLLEKKNNNYSSSV